MVATELVSLGWRPPGTSQDGLLLQCSQGSSFNLYLQRKASFPSIGLGHAEAGPQGNAMFHRQHHYQYSFELSKHPPQYRSHESFGISEPSSLVTLGKKKNTTHDKKSLEYFSTIVNFTRNASKEVFFAGDSGSPNFKVHHDIFVRTSCCLVICRLGLAAPSTG